MKFHAPSFFLGVGVTAAFVAARGRLRPVAVEVGALGTHLARVARGIAERQREDLEDYLAEVGERVRIRAREGRKGPAHGPGWGAAPAASATNGAARVPV
jgi:RNA 3'-terminal phosphate cyclase